MNNLRWRLGRSAVLVVFICFAILVGVAAAPGAPPRLYSNLRSSTWTAHLTNEDGAQGELWLRKTPCALGSFVQLKAPSVAGLATEERLVVREPDGTEEVLAVVPASMPDLGIVLAYWPTGTSMFPDEPSDLYVQFAANQPFGAAMPYPYESDAATWLTPDEYFQALSSGDVWAEVLVDGVVVLSGRVVR